MRKKKKISRGFSLIGIGILSLVFLINLVFSAIAFGLLFFTSTPLGVILWLPINVALILLSIYFFILDAAEG